MRTLDTNLILGRPGTHAGGVDTARELLDEMDRRDIERGWVSHLAGAVHDPAEGNDLLLRAMCAADADRSRLMPVPVAAPDRPEIVFDWDAWAALGAKGVRVCPAFYRTPADCAGWTPLLEALRGRGWFLQVPISPFNGARWPSGTVEDAVRLAAACPEVTVILLCGSRKNFLAFRTALERHANVWADVGNMTTGSGVPDLVARGFTDRLICGSGYAVSCSTPFRDVVRYAGIAGAAKRAILRDNALRLADGVTECQSNRVPE